MRRIGLAGILMMCLAGCDWRWPWVGLGAGKEPSEKEKSGQAEATPEEKPLPLETPVSVSTPQAEQSPAALPSPLPTQTLSPTPTPLPRISRKPMNVAQLFNGITYSNRMAIRRGGRTAAVERVDPESYKVEITVSLKRPRASMTLEDIRNNDPWLAEVFQMIPNFESLVTVSEAFERLYDLKEDWVKRRLDQLEQLLSRHNYYDCDTILEFTSPETERRVLILKGDMDVNTDGSDGDRNFAVDGSSPFFQPQTSYRWRKRTSRPNPFLQETRLRLQEAKEEYAIKGLSATRNAELRKMIDLLTKRMIDLENWSFLISAADPAIVLPGFMLRKGETGSSRASVGDYAVVLYDGKAYPVIVGDAGPSYKFGEGTLRLCREINQRASANRRPVSHLNVAYLVFPGTAEEPGPPDYAHWRKRCKELMAEIGLESIELHEWEDIVPPWPTPTPRPTPMVSPSNGVLGEASDEVAGKSDQSSKGTALGANKTESVGSEPNEENRTDAAWGGLDSGKSQ